MYSIYPKSLEERLAHAAQRTAELKEWKDSLPAFFEPTKVDPFILLPIFQRQSTVLTLAYAHALILANRQFLLSNFVDLASPPSFTDARIELHIRECVEAALIAVHTVGNLVEKGMLYRTFWFAQYISFCAVATLYVYAIRAYQTQRATTEQMIENNESLASKRCYMECFEAAEKCQALIASKTENNSPSRRYSIILDELRRQVFAEMLGTSSSLKDCTASDNHGLNPSNEGSAVLRERLSSAQDDVRPHDPFPGRKQGKLDSGTSSKVNLGPIDEPSSAADFPVLADTTLDSDEFGPPFEFVGWPELDSWVSNRSVSFLGDVYRFF